MIWGSRRGFRFERIRPQWPKAAEKTELRKTETAKWVSAKRTEFKIVKMPECGERREKERSLPCPIHCQISKFRCDTEVFSCPSKKSKNPDITPIPYCVPVLIVCMDTVY